MLPNYHLWGFEIQWYSFFHWLGVVIAIAFGSCYYYKQQQFKLSILQWLGFFAILYVLLLFGGRTVGMLEAYWSQGTIPNLSLLWKGPANGQFRWSGSLLFLAFFLPLISQKVLKINKQSLYHFFDMLALCLCLLTIFTKQGCQFSGDGCYGIVTALPWGMYYPYGIAPNILPVHPTPIYDSLFHLLFFVFLIWWNLGKKIAGQTAFIYFIGTAVFYFLLEFIRVNIVLAFDITIVQCVYLLILLVTLKYYPYLKKQSLALSNKQKINWTSLLG